jgi:Mce-associated membrane protein
MTVVQNERPTPVPPGPIVLVLAILTMLATLAALFFGTRLVLALTDDGLELAAARDTVVADARQAAVNLNTLNSADIDAGLDLWEQSSTGPMLEEYQRNRETYARFLREAKRDTEATVVDAAVSEIDVHTGTARVLIGIDVVLRPEGREPLISRQRMQIEMTRLPDGVWKASGIVPVR